MKLRAIHVTEDSKANNPIKYENQSKSVTFKTSDQTVSLNSATEVQGPVSYTMSGDTSHFSLSGTTLTVKANTPARTYTVNVTAHADGNDNYLAGDATSTVTVTVNKAANTLSYIGTQSVTKTFSTSSQTASLQAAKNNQGELSYAIQSQKKGSTTVSYFSLSGNTLNIKANTPAGTYTVVVQATAAGDNNYNKGTKASTVTVTIEKALISPEVTMEDWIYGDTAKDPSVTSGNPGGGDVSYKYKVKDAADTTYKDTKPSDAGSYTVKATVAETDNYKSGTATSDFAIAQQTVILDYKTDGTGNVTVYPMPQVPNGVVPLVAIEDNYDPDKEIPRSEYKLSVDMDNHEFTITDKEGGNYIFSPSPFIESYPFEVGNGTVKEPPAADEDLVYNGTAQPLLTGGGTAMHGNKDATMAYALGDNATTAPTDGWIESYTDIMGTVAGKYYVWYKAKGDGKPEGESIFSDSHPVCIRVTIQKAPLTVKANDHTITYGEAPSYKGVTYTGFVNGENETTLDVLSGKLEFRSTYSKGGDVNAAAEKDYGEFDIVPSGLTADNYAIHYENGTLKVNKKSVTISATAADKVYDGTTDATVTSSTVQTADLYPGDKLSVVEGTAAFDTKNVGTNKTVSFTGFGISGDKVGNYILPAQPVSVQASITPKSVTETDSGVTAVQAPGETLIYKGASNPPTLVVTDSKAGAASALAAGMDYDVTYVGMEPTVYENNSTAPTNVGSYKAVLTFKGNYSGTKDTLDVPFTIEPKSIKNATVTLENDDLTCDATEPTEQTVEVINVKVDDLTLTSDDYTLSGDTKATVQGIYYLKVEGKGNFKDTATKEWKITIGNPITVTAEDVKTDYDGRPHKITVTVKKPEQGFTIKYGNARGNYDLRDNPTFRDAGTYTVYFLVKAEGYDDYAGSATVTITPAPGGGSGGGGSSTGGNTTEAKTEGNKTTVTERDKDGNVVKTTETVKNDDGTTTETVTESGKTTVTEKDKDGKPTKTTETVTEGSKTTVTEVNADGSKTVTVKEGDQTTVTKYDKDGKIISDSGEEGSDKPAEKPIEDITFDDLTKAEQADADRLAETYGIDKDVAARMLKTGQSLGVSVNTMLLTTEAIGKLPNDSDPAGTSYYKLTAKAGKRGAKSMTLTWKTLPDADGYMVYSNQCGKTKKMKLKKTFTKNSYKKWKMTKLRKQKYYKSMVVAYKLVEGQKLPIAASVVVHCTTKAKKHTVARSLKLNKKKVVVAAGKTVKLKGKEIKQEKKKKIRRHRVVLYESVNPEIAKVNKKTGLITGVSAGKTTIYVYAQNGVFKKVPVTVK